MFDNLRDQASSSPFFQDNEGQPPEQQAPKPSRSARGLSALSARQKFVLAFMLMVEVCILGFVLLLVTGRLALPLF